MYGSAYVTANYLKLHRPNLAKVRVVGMNSICEELAKVSIQSVGGESELAENYTFESLCDHEIDALVGAVVVGLDLNFSYNKLALANLYIQKGAEFVATNDDAFDMVGVRMSPGAGVMVDSILLSLNDSMGG